MSFTIGDVTTGKPRKNADEYREHTSVSIVDEGISLYHYGGHFGMGGLGTYTVQQARELGHLLINAADRFDELTARIKQIEEEKAAMERGIKARIKDVLR